MVVEMATDKGNKKLDVDLRYACPLTSEVKSEGGYLIMKCNGAEHEGIPAALHAVVMMRVKSDGKIECKDGCLSVRGASSATVFLSAATNFVNYQDVSGDAYAKARCAIEGRGINRIKSCTMSIRRFILRNLEEWLYICHLRNFQRRKRMYVLTNSIR